MSFYILPNDLLSNCIMNLEKMDYKTIIICRTISKEYFISPQSDVDFLRSWFIKQRILRSMRQRFKRKRYQLFMKRTYRHPDNIPLWPPS